MGGGERAQIRVEDADRGTWVLLLFASRALPKTGKCAVAAARERFECHAVGARRLCEPLHRWSAAKPPLARAVELRIVVKARFEQEVLLLVFTKS